MEHVNIKDIEILLAYVSDRNIQAATTLNNMLMDRLKELKGESLDFPRVGVMLTNDPKYAMEHGPDNPLPEGTLFFMIFDLDDNLISTVVNTFFVIDLNTGSVEDQSANIVSVQ